MAEHSKKEVFKAWIRAARPPFYVATLIPIFLGLSLAIKDTGTFRPIVFLGALAICFLLHLSANLSNELFDYLEGTDTDKTLGGTGVIREGYIGISTLTQVIVACNILALLFAGIGMYITGFMGIWFIVLFGAISAYYYVSPPIKYGYRALGEVLVFINMGLVMVCGTYYSLVGSVPLHVVIISIPIGLMVAGILFYQSIPEIITDKNAGKKTLANLLGGDAALLLLKIWWPFIWVIMLLFWIFGLVNYLVVFGVILSIPLYIRLLKRVYSQKDDWEKLDRYGKYVRMMYVLCGLCLILSV